MSQAAWSCQRGVPIITCICALGMTPTIWADEMLFDVVADPHQQTNLADVQPQALQQGRETR